MQRFFTLTAQVSAERPLFIHPEGTRSYSDVIAPFHRGCARIARRTGRAVVPIASRGGDTLWPRGRWWPARGVLHVALGEPMTIGPDEDEKTFSDRVRAAMQSLAEGLRDGSQRGRSSGARPE